MTGFTKASCPITSAFVLAFRAEFGTDEVKVLAVHEGETHIGPEIEPISTSIEQLPEQQ